MMSAMVLAPCGRCKWILALHLPIAASRKESFTKSFNERVGYGFVAGGSSADEAPIVLLPKLKSAALAKKSDEVGMPRGNDGRTGDSICAFKRTTTAENHNPEDQGEHRWEISR
jgi:hypothetical protein